MKSGWERSNQLIIPDKEIVNKMLKPFLKEKEITRIQVLRGGLNNSNLHIKTNINENYVLRIYPKNRKSMNMER